jgi:DinB superfamily
MNEISQWFSDQLKSTQEGLTWSARQIPAERWLRQPPVLFGTWSAARHLYHMCFYEENIALPGMRIWLGDRWPGVDEDDEEKTWQALVETSLDGLCRKFNDIRQVQLELLPKYEVADWHRICPTGWGDVSLYWVVSKTFQHTAEHTYSIMSQALFWDRAE